MPDSSKWKAIPVSATSSPSDEPPISWTLIDARSTVECAKRKAVSMAQIKHLYTTGYLTADEYRAITWRNGNR
jgi:hypothetical protein